MMKRYQRVVQPLVRIVAIAWICLSFAGCSQTTPSTLLWKISGHDLQQPSYLYGTIHLKDKRVFAFSKAVHPAFAETTLLAVEVLPDSLSQMRYLSKIMLDEGQTLESLFSPEDYELVQHTLQQKLGMQAIVAEKMKPIFIGTMLLLNDMNEDASIASADDANEDSLVTSVTVDEYFLQKAREQRKKAVGIETVDEQFAALESISLEEQAKMLVEQIRDTTQTDSLLQRMVHAYASADLDALMELVAESEMPGEAMHSLLTKRNYIMAERATALMAKEPVFIAVGAGHLAGDEGIIALLRKKGYTVETVMP